MKSKVFIISLMFLCHLSWAKDIFDHGDYYFETIGNSEQIPSGVISAITQDDKGFIWIGTVSGLIRYDGYTFKHYPANIHSANSLSGDYILSLHQDAQGDLWVGTSDGGVSIYNPDTDSFRQLLPSSEGAAAISHMRVNDILSGQDGYMLLATNAGLDVYDVNNHSTVSYTKHNSFIPHNTVTALYRDSKDRVWLGTDKGALLVEQKGADIKPVEFKRHKQKLANIAVESFFEDSKGQMWIATKTQGLFSLTNHSELVQFSTQTDESLSHDTVVGVVQINEQTLWVGSYGGGIDEIDIAHLTVTKSIRHDPIISSSINSDHIGQLYKDRSGLVWVGTWGAGLNRYNSINQAMRFIKKGSLKTNTLSDKAVLSVLELSNGEIWVGTRNHGIDIIDVQSGTFSNIPPQKGMPGALQDGAIKAMAQSDDGRVWVATRQSGLYQYDASSKAFEKISINANVRRLYYGHGDVLWTGTSGGLAKINTATHEVIFVPTSENKAEPMREEINALAVASDGSLWIGGSGLFVLPAKGEHLIPVRHNPNNPSSLSNDNIKDITVDANDQIWIDTASGLNRLVAFDGREAIFENINTKIGEDANYLMGNLLPDEQNNLWSAGGVFDSDNLFHYTFLNAEGADNLSFEGSYARTRSGTLLFGGVDGITLIKPQRFQKWQYQPHVLMTQLKINGKKSILGTEPLVLADNNKSFSIEFSSSDTSNPTTTKFHYRLSGFSDEWIETDHSHRVISYTNLNPGNYLLEVKATDRFGQLSPHSFSLDIEKLPMWYETSLFKMTIILLATAVSFFIYHIRIQQINRHRKLLAIEVKKRTQDILMLSEIGRKLTATHELSEITELLYASINQVLNAEVVLLGIVDREKSQLIVPFMVENNAKMDSWSVHLDDFQRPGVWCINHETELVIMNESQRQQYLGNVRAEVKVGKPMASIVYQPLKIKNDVIGCISIQCSESDAYNERQIDMIRTLASYTAIAVSNALGYEKLETSNRQLAHAHKELEKLSLTDPLTGLYNRRFLSNVMDKEIAGLKRKLVSGEEERIGFLLVDADHFKSINDTYGHDAGDRVLRQLSDIFVETCRESDWIIRWGGEEFLVIAHSLTPGELPILAERLRHKVEEFQFDIGSEQRISRTCSLGGIEIPIDNTAINLLTWEEAANLADLAMYLAKTNGRNAWVLLIAETIDSHQQFKSVMKEDHKRLIREGFLKATSSFKDKTLDF